MIFPLLINVQFFGGMSIAIMRYTVIRYTKIIARHGEVKIMGTILVLWQAVLLGNTYLTAVNSMDVYKSRCYREAAINYYPGPIFLLACGTKFAIYFSIFYYVYQSDIEVRQFISSDSYRRRKRKNAFNIFGHSIHFLIELVMILGAIILLRTNIISASLRVFNQFAPTLMSVSKLLLSKPMQNKWTHLFICLEDKFRKFSYLRVLKTAKITPNELDSLEKELISKSNIP